MKNHKQHNVLSISELCKKTLNQIDWSNKDVYAQYLAQSYYYVHHSEKLLALSIALFSTEDRPLQRRFIKHLSEENAHDLLLLSDLKNLGYQISDIEEMPATKIFWETQYYKIEHQDPAALLGYIYFLEDLACQVGPELTSKLEALYGRKPVSFLKLHAEEDPDHVTKAMALIDSLPPERRKAIVINHEQSMRAFCLMLEEIMDSCESQEKQAA